MDSSMRGIAFLLSTSTVLVLMCFSLFIGTEPLFTFVPFKVLISIYPVFLLPKT